MFKCPRCTREFYSKDSLLDHLKNHPRSPAPTDKKDEPESDSNG